MTRATVLLLGLFHAAAVHLSRASDACPGQEEAVTLSPHHLLELTDAGTEFYQRSVLATHRGKEAGAAALQSSVNIAQEPKKESEKESKKAITKVKPLACDGDDFQPLQSIKGEDGFSIKRLNIKDGHYEEMYTYPWDKIKGDYADMNACDVSPYDDIIYCVVRADGESYAVRLDENTVEFVAKLPASVWSAAAFTHNGGHFFVSMSGGETIVTPPLHKLQGYEDPKDKKLTSYKSLKAHKPEGFESISDSVIVNRNFTGGIDGHDTYMIVLYGPKMQIAAYLKGKPVKTWIKVIEPGRWDNIWGAAWHYQDKVFFSTNRGAGVYGIPLDTVDLSDDEQVVRLNQIGMSDATDYNDGLCCHNIPNPWGADNSDVPEETGGTFSTSTGEPAQAEPAEADAPIAPIEPAPAPIESAPAPIEPAPAPIEPAPVGSGMPEEFAPKPPPPPGTGLFAFLIFLVIPCMLCCLRHSQKNQSDFMATPYPTGRFTPPPSSEHVVAAPAPPPVFRPGSAKSVHAAYQTEPAPPPSMAIPPVLMAAPPPSATIISEPASPASPVPPSSPMRPKVMTAVPTTMLPPQAPVTAAAPVVTEVIVSQPPQVTAYTQPSMAAAAASAQVVLETTMQPTPGFAAASATSPMIAVDTTVTTVRAPTPPSRGPSGGRTPPDKPLGSSFGTVTTTSEVPVVEFAPSAGTRPIQVVQPRDTSFGTITSDVPVLEFLPPTGRPAGVQVRGTSAGSGSGSPTIATVPSPVSSTIYKS